MPEFTSPGGDGAIVAGGNTAAVLAAAADNVDETQNPLFVYAALAGFDGATLDMIRALANDSDGISETQAGVLDAAARLIAFNGTTFDRLRSEGNDRDAIAVATLGKLEAIIYGHLFNGTTWDRQRSLGSVSLDGLGQGSVSNAVPGAGVVQAIHFVGVSSTTTRATLHTPASGRRIRMLSAQATNNVATGTFVGIYFGTGAAMATTPANAIANWKLDTDTQHNGFASWPDGAGPVGAVDEVLSVVTQADLSSDMEGVVVFREE